MCKQITQVGLRVVLLWKLRQAELQFQRIVVEAGCVGGSEMPCQKLCGFQGHLGALLGGDRVVVQAGAPLQMRDVANAMGKGREGPEQIVEIEGGSPVSSNEPSNTPMERRKTTAGLQMKQWD